MHSLLVVHPGVGVGGGVIGTAVIGEGVVAAVLLGISGGTVTGGSVTGGTVVIFPWPKVSSGSDEAPRR